VPGPVASALDSKAATKSVDDHWNLIYEPICGTPFPVRAKTVSVYGGVDYTSNIDSNQLRGMAANVGIRVSW
jgi:hypothetical protein